MYLVARENDAHVELRGQLVGGRYLLPCEPWELNSGLMAGTFTS